MPDATNWAIASSASRAVRRRATFQLNCFTHTQQTQARTNLQTSTHAQTRRYVIIMIFIYM